MSLKMLKKGFPDGSKEAILDSYCLDTAITGL